MPHFHPWRYLRDHHPDWTVIWAALPGGLLGRALPDLRVIVLDSDGRLVLDGSPREVFGQNEQRLRELGAISRRTMRSYER